MLYVFAYFERSSPPALTWVAGCRHVGGGGLKTSLLVCVLYSSSESHVSLLVSRCRLWVLLRRRGSWWRLRTQRPVGGVRPVSGICITNVNVCNHRTITIILDGTVISFSKKYYSCGDCFISTIHLPPYVLHAVYLHTKSRGSVQSQAGVTRDRAPSQ